jgi:Chaperone of endosialidase
MSASYSNKAWIINSTGGAGTLKLTYTSTAVNQTYTFPSDGTINQVLQTNGAGVLTWTNQTATVALSSILPAVATNTIDSLNFAQIWNWSTASTQSPFTWNANTLTSGTFFSLNSSSVGLTGNLLSLTLSGSNVGNSGSLLNLNSSGALSTAVCLNITQNGNANLITASTTVASNAISLVQITAATSGANNNSPIYKSIATFWTGAVSSQDVWSNQIILGAGANPTSTYSLIHTGSTGVASVQLPAGAGLLFPGSSSGTVGFKPAAANTSVTWQLPAADGAANQFLQTNGSGVLTFASQTTSTPLSSILPAIAGNTIDSLNFAQVWNWSTASTQTPFTWNGNGLTSGTLFSLASSATGLTGNLLNLTLSGSNAANTGSLLNINSSGAASAAVGLTITVGNVAGGDNIKLVGGNNSGASNQNYISFHAPAGTLIGSITQNISTGVQFNYTSDRNVKENITQTSMSGLKIARQLDVVDFNYKFDPEKIKVQGFIAQDVFEVYKSAVTVGNDKRPWQMDPTKLMPVVVQAEKELYEKHKKSKTRIEFLESKIEILENQNQKLLERIDRLEKFVF